MESMYYIGLDVHKLWRGFGKRKSGFETHRVAHGHGQSR
jgi:hypothetical protein